MSKPKIRIALCAPGEVDVLRGYLDQHWSREHVLSVDRALRS